MMNIQRYWLLLVLVLVQAGCSIGGPSRPSEFYVLNAEPGTPIAGAANRQLVIGLGPVALPDILDRPQIVTRPESNRIALAEFDRWGGDLNKALVRVLSQNLMSRLNTDRVLPYPWSSASNPDFQVAVRFFRFDGEPGKSTRVEGVWRLLNASGCEYSTQRFRIEKQPAGEGYAEFVAAMSDAVADLSQQIAEKIATTQSGCE